MIADEAPLFIGGEERRTGEILESRNPARPDQVVGRVAVASVQDVEDAFAAASDAAPAWASTPGPARGEVLFRAAELLAQRAEQVATELTDEEGKTLREARGEVARGVQVLRFHAGEASRNGGTLYPSAGRETFLYSVREPLGVVSVITPWNFPVAIPLWKIAPALAAGNTVVFKPSDVTPLGGVRIAEVLRDAGLPAGVLNLVNGLPAEIGDAMTLDPRIDGISFTGSVGVGDLLRRHVATTRAKLQLELGGKNAVVVLDDADVGQAVDETVKGAFGASGQKCTATSRIFVTPGIADEYLGALTARVAALRVGDPHAEATDLGPLVSEAQQRRVDSYLALAADERHEIVVGGQDDRPDEGWFVRPTILAGVPATSRIAREEIFGPVAAVTQVADLADAIEATNDSAFGLSAAVFTRDLRSAHRFAVEARVGMVHVNSETPGGEPQVPFGGLKASSSGAREQGPAAVDFFTSTKTVYVDLPPGP